MHAQRLHPAAFLFALLPALIPAQEPTDSPLGAMWDVTGFGGVGDGETDNTAAFQRALDTAWEAGGGVVWAPTGNYLFEGSLNVPREVTLRGVYHYAPAHAGVRDNTDQLPKYGTAFHVRAGAGSEDGPAFIQLNNNSTLQGVCIYYPGQDPQTAPPTPYPFTVVMRENNPALIDVELLNPYNGIDASRNQRALIRNVHGQPLHIGVFVDTIYDIGRIENVHWNPWWSLGTDLYKWQEENGRAFVFGRTDWHYVHNTFAFGYKIGYHFVDLGSGSANGNFLGIGADRCHTAVQVDQSAPYGLLITNGEFVSFMGEEPTMVRVSAEHTGHVRFLNSAFWGPTNRIGVIDGKGTVTFSDCNFHAWGLHDGPTEAFLVKGGSIMIRGSEFQWDLPQVTLEAGVSRAIISENFLRGTQRITNNAEGNVVIVNNVSDE
jgi:hypothetical protein